MGKLNLAKYECPPEVFAEISKSLLRAGRAVRFTAVGDSMFPFIQNGDLVVIEPAQTARLKNGDVLFYQDINGHCLLHRIIRKRNLAGTPEYQIQADNVLMPGGWVSAEQVLGCLARFYRNDDWIRMDNLVSKLANLLILFQLKFKLNKYSRFRSGRKYFRYLTVFCKYL